MLIFRPTVAFAGVVGFFGCSDSTPNLKIDATPTAIDAAAEVPDAQLSAFSIACASPLPNDREICTGTADPTEIDPEVSAVATGIVPGAVGKHWFCRPGDGQPWNGRLLLHLVGTYSNPADDFRFAERACALGFAAIVPMYKNRDAVRQTCQNDGICYESFHQEIIYGTPVAPAPVDVNVKNSILSRARGLTKRLITGDPQFSSWRDISERIAGADWSSIALSGHSQGSGHALFLARDFAAERLVILAGPADRLNDGQPNHAVVPWISQMATTPPRTPIGNIYTFLHADDGIEIVAQVQNNWDVMGIGSATCTFANVAGYSPSCRRVAINSDNCSAYNAHATVVVRQWGAKCGLGVAPIYVTRATWTFLLLN
jgi:hypothetical protein